MPIEMTERLERALEEWDLATQGKEHSIVTATDNLFAAYREARDAIQFANADGHTVPVPVEECFAGADKVVSGTATVTETPLTTERLVRVLRSFPAAENVYWVVLGQLADALEAEEE